MIKDAILKVKILDGTELDKRLARTTVKFENDLTITLPNSLLHLEERVVVPKVVGDWIFKSQLIDSRSLRSALETATIRLYAKNGEEVIDWLKDTSNQDIFARAWANGYEDEKEKQYLVKIIGIKDYDSYLNYRKEEKVWTIESKMEVDTIRTKHTKKQLEEAGFGWVFDCEGIEIEEVTE